MVGERETCATCGHFDGQDGLPGLCRRYAPRPVVQTADASPHWPLVEPADDWCGEWQAR